ncbi:Uma2 family endonuclease [Saccharothrix algeriensis]|uniref:Uma2 family endonuclease n=1 Tax=Saccharothrix algeriensis TaxID=173560 RepID=A0A8T8I4Y4_9PSEU|nr:Uma2 family endonuclease [Saccharothrix algeriensis]MBM7812207.1 Uma2 family endonuclease [Saccharothrix algeriensis]QTR05836.1 Uma2 family endonuclease [Saccharothrix algeriensis]
MSSTAHRYEGYTLDDWEALEPREGRRIELVNGRFRVSAAPATPHQRVADRLCRFLDAAVEPLGLEAISAIGVRVGRMGYIPDLVVCEPQDATSISSDTVRLVVEVLSPSTATIDRLEKAAAYAAVGVPAYWLVELPREGLPVIRCNALDRNAYTEIAVAAPGGPVDVEVVAGVPVKLDVDVLFAPRR